ncbi:MAG TPA: hypothetical protein VJ723_02920 [Candidatus Angelobacter sp.]|nr:hypothetical protein [Candidatus Angelobacter sp.]
MADTNEAKRALLAEWEKKRDDLNTLIAALRNELGMPGISTSESSSFTAAQVTTLGPNALDVNSLVQPGDFFGRSQIAAAQSFLERTGRQPATLQDIAAALYRGKVTDKLLEGTDLRNLSSLLSRSQQFMSVARGRWGLSDWYPGKKKVTRAKAVTEQKNSAETTE